jgi:hypothetical protein
MDRFALRSVNLGLITAVLGCSSAVFAQEAPPAAAPAADAPAATAPAAPPAPEPAVEAPAPAPAAAEVPPAEAPPAKPKPPPYSLPWQLRPVVAASVVRSDTAFAFYKDNAGKESGSTVASMLLASYKVTDNIAPMVRLGIVSNSPPSSLKGPDMKTVDSATNFINPVVGATYAIKPAKPLRLAFFLGATIPIGSGGGDDAKLKNTTANGAGIRARSAMDNAMFLVNDFSVIPGVGFAYVGGGFTAQVEATLIQAWRVKGDKQPAMGLPKNPDKSKTNLTMGLHVGYFLIPMLSVGVDFRHQRFLSTPKAVEADDNPANTPMLEPQGLRDTTTFAIGPRMHFKLSDSVWFRPGVAFAMPIDKPMETGEYKIVQLDLPIAF